MMHEYRLTITILTMNRAQQMKNAVESCVRAKLPENTQFVIVDNASSDDTEEVAKGLKENIPYDVVYHKESVNKGVGGGRNICFDLAKGEYVFFLDDDAEIAEECAEVFFEKTLRYLDENPQVATLTTQVVDHVFGDRAVVQSKTKRIGGLPCAYTFHGGTVFMRKSAFTSPIFLNIMYGNEEVSLSAKVRDNGYQNVYDPEIYINHCPIVDKWKDDSLDYINMCGASNLYAIKKLQYPTIFLPALWLVYQLRIYRYKLKDKSLIGQFREKNKEFCRVNKIEKIKIRTVLDSLKEFGMTTF